MATTAGRNRLKRSGKAAGELVWLVATLILSRLSVAIIAAILAIYLFGLLAFRVFHGATQQFDLTAMEYFKAHQPDWLHTPMTLVTRLADGWTIAGVTLFAVIGFTVARRFWPDGATMLLAAIGGLGIIEGLKVLFARDRPEFDVYTATGYSFPSGHSFFVLTIYGMLAYRLSLDAPAWRRRGIWALVVALILLVGSSRVFLGVHYPTDVAGGFLAGLFWLWGCLAVPRFRRVPRWGSYRERRISDYEEAKSLLAHLDEERKPLRACAASLLPREERILPRIVLAASLKLEVIYDRWLHRVPVFEKIRLDLLLLATVMRWLKPTALTECWQGSRSAEEVLDTVHEARRKLLGTALDD